MEQNFIIKQELGGIETEEDRGFHSSHPNLRPQTFADYPGQEHVKENLKVSVSAAKKRQSTLDHVLLHGPPGLGKTTLARIVALEMGAKFVQTSGPSIAKPGDLVGILASLDVGTILFIDEIHRLTIQVEEILYSAMEDFMMDIVIGAGPTARTVNMPLPPFTLIGATTKASSLSRPLRNRFGLVEKLGYYDLQALSQIIETNSVTLDLKLGNGAADMIASASRGTPRIANRLLKRIRDYAAIKDQDLIDDALVEFALSRLEIDGQGLERMDRQILKTIAERYQGGPVGLETLAATLGEDRHTLEEVFEPYLVHIGYLARGPRGRSLTVEGAKHLQKYPALN